MFAEPCDRDSGERVAATTAISEYLGGSVQQSYPGADTEALSTAIWGLVHGLAFLHLDGKLDAATPAVGRLGCAPRSTHCSQLLTPRRGS